MPGNNIKWRVTLNTERELKSHLGSETRAVLEQASTAKTRKFQQLLKFLDDLLGLEEVSLEFADDGVAIGTNFSVFKPGHRAEEVSRVG